MLQTSAEFPTTCLSHLLRTATEGTALDAASALNKFCEIYWKPIYAYARRKGLSSADAEDCVQEVLAYVASHPIPASCLSGKMKLRVYLMRLVIDVLSEWHDRAIRKKRGSGVSALSLNIEETEQRIRAIDHQGAANILFDFLWARGILDRCLELLRVEETAHDRGAALDVLLPFLDSTVKGDANYSAASAVLNQSEVSTRQQVHRLRQRYKAVLRHEIAQTLSAEQGGEPTEAMILDEMRYMAAALQKEA